MIVLIIKKVPGKRWEVGTNLPVHKKYGRELIKKRYAAEIPEYSGGVFYLDGRPSDDMRRLQRTNIKDFPITIAEYEHYLEKNDLKNVSKGRKTKKYK